MTAEKTSPLEAPRTVKSPIEDQLIAGEMYWDQIDAQWYRLLDRRGDLKVVGSYRAVPHIYSFGPTKTTWFAVVNEGPDYPSHEFSTPSEARDFIELRAI